MIGTMTHLVLALAVAAAGVALSRAFSSRLFAYSAGRKSGLEWLEGRYFVASAIFLVAALCAALAICGLLDLPLRRVPIVIGGLTVLSAAFILGFKLLERWKRL
jgi:hypothetical protein